MRTGEEEGAGLGKGEDTVCSTVKQGKGGRSIVILFVRAISCSDLTQSSEIL